ncbi:NAD-dependent epimerase/dehydratase family protein [candidate division NPL-UPA2 bacterium]|nr:NAD-dependent epimerase/dehydratase family protein [candidate division NPL-UPA2 bacterium]
MKILITGGAGFIGSNLSSFLANKGAKITVLDDFSQGVREHVENPEFELIAGGVENEGLINSLQGKNFDFIHHQAAITDTTVDDREKMLRVNVDGLKNILYLARKENAKVIYVSSAGVYGDGAVPMRESQKPVPLNAYALSKIRADELALAFAQEQDMKIIGLRYFNVYGPGEKHKGKSASMIWQLACSMKQGKNPRIFKWGEQERDFIYVKDIVEATAKAMEAEEAGIVNIGTGKRTDFNRIIEILNEVLGADFKPEYFDNPYSFYQNQTQADTALAAHLLGFKAKFSIEEGIRDYFSASPTLRAR